ncbi:hypothetical protein CRG98_020883 [Punica granatum]|uniref:Uncharacterized protein n=1 Tax=Punica granatum TaxID=22663 RepID=A0A2I0JQZ3_PUNGR|nr:hypothetical protein CRG98_020883 [Punica granatum]
MEKDGAIAWEFIGWEGAVTDERSMASAISRTPRWWGPEKDCGGRLGPISPLPGPHDLPTHSMQRWGPRSFPSRRGGQSPAIPPSP